MHSPLLLKLCSAVNRNAPYADAFAHTTTVPLVQKTGYDAWLEQWNLPEGADPLTVTNGVPLAAQYLFGIVPMSRVTDIDGNPMMNIGFDA